jgi:hypothetical protein
LASGWSLKAVRRIIRAPRSEDGVVVFSHDGPIDRDPDRIWVVTEWWAPVAETPLNVEW